MISPLLLRSSRCVTSVLMDPSVARRATKGSQAEGVKVASLSRHTDEGGVRVRIGPWPWTRTLPPWQHGRNLGVMPNFVPKTSITETQARLRAATPYVAVWLLLFGGLTYVTLAGNAMDASKASPVELAVTSAILTALAVLFFVFQDRKLTTALNQKGQLRANFVARRATECDLTWQELVPLAQSAIDLLPRVRSRFVGAGVVGGWTDGYQIVVIQSSSRHHGIEYTVPARRRRLSLFRAQLTNRAASRQVV